MQSIRALPSLLAGPWKSLEEVGRGATAVVHRAKHTSSGQVAALKIVPAALAGEAAIVSAIGRRWGPGLLDAGRVGDDVYLALEWTEGTPLSDHRGKDPERTAAIVAHAVGRALAELHAAGVRHGDVKPANVLVAETDFERAHRLFFTEREDEL